MITLLNVKKVNFQKYTRRLFISTYFILVIACLPSFSSAQAHYDEGDWVSYADFNQVSEIVVGRDYIYFATIGGILRYHRYRQRWEDPWVVVRGFEAPVDLRWAVNLDYLAETEEVAVLTSHGAFLYNPVAQYWKTTNHAFSPLPALPADLSEAVFLDLPDYTVSHRTYFLQGQNTIMDSNLKRYPLTMFAEDDWGGWWMAIGGVGILQMDSHTKRGTVWETGLFGRDIQAIARGGGWTILAGHNREEGITFWKRRENIWDHLESEYKAGLESTWISDLAVSGNYVLAATDYGLTQINLKNGNCRTWTSYDGLWSNNTLSVAVKGDTAWVGTESGVCQIAIPQGPVFRLEQEAIQFQPAYRIAVDEEAIWIGGEIGLFRLDRRSGTGNYLGLEGGVGGPVTALSSLRDEIWVGRMSGIEVVDKKSRQQTGYPAQAFFAGGTVNAIIGGDSLVWVGTNRGLWKFDRIRNRWHQYTREDGLIEDRVQAVFQEGNHLLLGTPGGVTRFYWNDTDRVD